MPTTASPAVADLGDISILDQIQYAVLKPGSLEPTGWVITLAGPYHEKAVAWQSAANQKRLQRQAKIEAQQLNNRKIKPEERTQDDTRAENVGFLVSRILDWTPVRIPFIADEPLAFSDEMATRVFSHTRMGWAFQQVVDVINDEGSFTPRSATT